MKKLKIKAAKEKLEVLTREQLMLVIGGEHNANFCLSHNEECSNVPASACCDAFDCIQVGGGLRQCKWT